MASHKPEQNGLAEPSMLEKIDRLFACGVGELVDLPQIVVIGDQSSGKSSVLEGLIQKPLPRDSGLCTRFATQIVFRRALQQQILVSIIPDRDASREHVNLVTAWGRTVPDLDPDTFKEIMEEAHIKMGLTGEGERNPTFSNDVLRLEISGPEQEHLSVIDVPGIFKSTTEGLTTKADIQLVRNMVRGYMDNPRSIMLAVVPANVDLATQEILELAAEVDAHGDRTLGVLTKPDLVDKGAEQGVMDILAGRTRRMKLEWHIIRNPGQKELQNPTMDRGTLEADFFRSHEPWSSIEKDKAGINSLRLRLKEIHSSLVKRVFPKVKLEIRGRLDACQKQIDDLGPERNTSADQMVYLTTPSTKFERLVTLALSATHGASEAFEDPRMRIAPAIMSRMKAFSDEMDKCGHTFAFKTKDDDKPSNSVTEQPHPTPAFGTPSLSKQPAQAASPFGNFAATPQGSSATAKQPPQAQGMFGPISQPSGVVTKQPPTHFNTRKETDLAELIEILHSQRSLPIPEREGIYRWLMQVYQSNRGFELGTPNSALLADCMKKQCSKWKEVSMGFVSDVIVLVHTFIGTALCSICKDVNVRTALINKLSDDLIERYQKAITTTQFLLEVEKSDVPMSLNHYFNDNLQRSRQGHAASQIKGHSFNVDGIGAVVRVEHATPHTKNMSNENFVVQDLHDILQSYYKVSRKTFVNSVCRQAVIHYLLSCDKSPLRLFSPVFVSQLSPMELDELVGEEPGFKRARIQLNKDKKSLMEAMKILASS